jgi:hypothetical protein
LNEASLFVVKTNEFIVNLILAGTTVVASVSSIDSHLLEENGRNSCVHVSNGDTIGVNLENKLMTTVGEEQLVEFTELTLRHQVKKLSGGLGDAQNVGELLNVSGSIRVNHLLDDETLLLADESSV